MRDTFKTGVSHHFNAKTVLFRAVSHSFFPCLSLYILNAPPHPISAYLTLFAMESTKALLPTFHSISAYLTLYSTLLVFDFLSAFIFHFIYPSLSCKQLDVCLLCYYYCRIFEATFTSFHPGEQFGSPA